MIEKIKMYLRLWKIYSETKTKIGEELKMGKSFFASKTVWFNLLSGALGVAATLSDSPLAADPKVKAGFAAFVSIGNIILRLLTDTAIETVLPQKPV